MSQLLDYTKKLTKNREKNRKIIFGSELSEANNELTLRIHQKNDKKSRKKNRKIIFGSKWSEANNEPTFRLYQKIDKKIEIFLAQNCLKRIMSQLLEYT